MWIDIKNSYGWYQQLCNKCHFRLPLVMSTIRHSAVMHCWYQQSQFLISTIQLLISRIYIIDINIAHTILVSTIHIIDINNAIVEINNWHFWYQQYDLFISTIRIVDVNNYVINNNSAFHISRVNYVRRRSAKTWKFNRPPKSQSYINWFQIWHGW